MIRVGRVSHAQKKAERNDGKERDHSSAASAQLVTLQKATHTSEKTIAPSRMFSTKRTIIMPE
jgi:hypothetical protein